MGLFLSTFPTKLLRGGLNNVCAVTFELLTVFPSLYLLHASGSGYLRHDRQVKPGQASIFPSPSFKWEPSVIYFTRLPCWRSHYPLQGFTGCGLNYCDLSGWSLATVCTHSKNFMNHCRICQNIPNWPSSQLYETVSYKLKGSKLKIPKIPQP